MCCRCSSLPLTLLCYQVVEAMAQVIEYHVDEGSHEATRLAEKLLRNLMEETAGCCGGHPAFEELRMLMMRVQRHLG